MSELDREPAPPGEKYYGLVFGSQINRLSFRHAHTWATVVKVNCNDPNSITIDTISWLPVADEVRPWHFKTEPGYNADLFSSLDRSIAEGQKIAVWGPFEIHPGLYRKFLLQKQFLESGVVGYQANDTIGEAARTGDASNCVHAITDMDSEWGRAGYPLFRVGFPASKRIVKRIRERKALVDPRDTNDWLYSAMELDRYSLDRRKLPLPNPINALLSPIHLHTP